jgi:hypothetical protein
MQIQSGRTVLLSYLPVAAKFSIPTNLPAARFAAPDKRKSWLFNMAVQLGMAIGRYALPSFLLLHCSMHPAIKQFIKYVSVRKLLSEGILT